MLRDAGFAVHEEPFAYSASVGRWAMPLAGALVGASVLAAAWLGAHGEPRTALAGLLIAAAVVVVGAPWASRVGVLALPTERRRATNLVATRGGDAPSVWLVAHLDSKSQPIPMLARVAGVVGSAVAWIAAVVASVAQSAGVDAAPVWVPLAAFGALAAVPVVGSVIGARSPGALDNASGVATVLLALDPTLDAPALPSALGVLLPSAEELGLAGARAWVRGALAERVRRGASARPVAVNVDGVDDAGALTVLARSNVPHRFLAELAADDATVVRRVPAGVLVDAIALAEGGFDAVTVSRGTAATLARIHRPGDSLANLRGDGILEAARLVRRLAAAAAG